MWIVNIKLENESVMDSINKINSSICDDFIFTEIKNSQIDEFLIELEKKDIDDFLLVEKYVH